VTQSGIDTAPFKAELEEHQERLQKIIDHHDIGSASLTESTGELLSSSADNHLADTASETYERELDEGIEEDAKEQLREVVAALARIESGTYGTCSVCGKPIPAERLEAVPWTTLCIDDARKLAR
jgi:RNA polymerase-binding transcription factor DksA